jgi:hypothetical protein
MYQSLMLKIIITNRSLYYEYVRITGLMWLHVNEKDFKKTKRRPRYGGVMWIDLYRNEAYDRNCGKCHYNILSLIR